MTDNRYQKVKSGTMRIKKGDMVKIMAGGHKGTVAKVERTSARDGLVYLEKIGLISRRVRPSQLHPRGGTKETHRGIPVSNVALIVDEAKGTTSRVIYNTKTDGKKVRIAQATRKEIA